MNTETDRKTVLVKQVIMGDVEHAISTVLFRHAVGNALGVNATDMSCLAAIFFKGLSTPSELARLTGLSSGATTTMLDRLERRGLIERCFNPKDRRSRLIVIPKAATEKVASLYESMEKAEDEFVSKYSEKELQLLADFFRTLEAIWHEEREKLQRRPT
jgi:DNA-binding MarR family transcriptional regulator